ncbi:GerAB/ArcD/ProY family transporter [Pontibacillus marinus]|uniref:Spore germination protein GerB n=1 Tax=Pontibacillus marinus BH030004 = DSM 16465 TaxID=1385511 RepID=A0A0A5GEW9_9BACI|nr:GerAB/ArcD/ProY family transporter [Pontibacillus marinus]KGX91771.1 spore germination protein GerB [Pontibacillus marinus BH030004 = DSM 16465]
MRVPIQEKVSTYMVFYLITSVQVGVGILSYQSQINKHAGHDAWMSVLIAGLFIHITIWMIYVVLKGVDGDLVEVNKQVFGKVIGSVFTILYMLYLVLGATIVIRIYIEVVQVWMFPQMKVWSILFLILPLVFYIINGSFRVVVGICFLGFIVPAFLMTSFLFPLQYSNLNLVLPVFDHTFQEFLLSANEAALSFIGISVLMIYYPFIKEKEQSQKWAHFGNLTTTFIYTVLAIITFTYYNQPQLSSLKWPTLDMWKIIEMPFVARFEYAGISTWFLVILPNLTLFLWAASRMMYRQFQVSQQKSIVLFLIAVFIGCFFMETREELEKVTKVFSMFGRGILYVYIPFIFLTYCLLRKGRRK